MFGNIALGRRRASGPPHGGRLRARWAAPSVLVGIGIGALGSAYADPSIVLPSGLPVQVRPTFPEPGLPAFSFPIGGSSSVGGSTSGGYTSGGSASTGGSASVGSTSGSGDAYNLMMAQDWGPQAADAAAAMGVTAAALAATCEMESQCQNTGAAPGAARRAPFR